MDAVAREALGRSVNDKLKAMSKKDGFNTQFLQVRYALESFLKRLQTSEHAGRFVLKGGMLMLATGEQHRPTEDADLHGIDSSDPEQVVRIFQEIAAEALPCDDGVSFDFSTLKYQTIREGFIPGCRVAFDAHIGESPVRMKFDVCFGDAIIPNPVMRTIPAVLRGGADVTMPCYPWETVIAEKVHAVVEFGMDATRLKDFYDLGVIARTEAVDGALAVEAMRASFGQRGTALETAPVGFSDQFISARSKDFDRWASKRGPLRHSFGSLADLIAEIRPFVLPVCEAAANDGPDPGMWSPGSGWERIDLKP